MSNNILLNWATLAVSLMNTILLIWLGFTVLFNADRPSWGITLSGSGLLLGAAFFVSHTAIIGLTPAEITWRNTIFWWTGGLIPAIMLPLAWYIIILWYAGFWSNPPAKIRHRQQIWFTISVLMAIVGLGGLILGVILLALPITELPFLRLLLRYSFNNIPLLAVAYSIYVVLCFVLSLDALRNPISSTRIMGTEARQRAQPWLVAASIALLIVSFLVTGVMLWVVQDVSRRTFFEIYAESTNIIAIADLIIETIIGIAIILLGQAVVSYEIFTGKTLPRRGLARHWNRVLLLAIGYGIAIGGTLAIHVRPIYSLLLTTILMASFSALIVWRSFVQRERYIDNLRPFVSSQQLYEQILTEANPQDADFITPFNVLCTDILDAKIAYLLPLGSLTPLINQPLIYPQGTPFDFPQLADLMSQFDSPDMMTLALNPDQYNGIIWAIPLWGERGIIGAFLLGTKNDGGLYTQEEIEIARAVCERLIDTQASAEMSQRLMTLQRERLSQSQIIDQQTRRVLHDDILPNLQTALIALSSNQPTFNEADSKAASLITEAHKQISDLLHNMPTITVPDVARVGVIAALQNSIAHELAEAFEQVNWHIPEQTIAQAKQIPIMSSEVLFYATREVIRNAARHGGGGITLTITGQWQDGLVLTIKDNGIGIANAQSTAGTGQGLALHTTMMAVVGGNISIESVPEKETAVTLSLPVK